MINICILVEIKLNKIVMIQSHQLKNGWIRIIYQHMKNYKFIIGKEKKHFGEVLII